MDKTRNRLSFILAGGTACIIASAPAIGQQTSTPTPQVTGQQTTAQTTAQPGPAGTQPAGPGTGTGLQITLDYLSTLQYDDNLDLDDPSLGSTSRWENSLALSVVNQTPDSLLTFDLSGLHRFADQPIFGSSSDFTDPALSLAYSRNSANSQFNSNFDYSETDLNFNRSLSDLNQDGVIDAADIAVDGGTHVASRAGLNLQTGINNPLGFIFSFDRQENTFSNTTDPDLFDNLTNFYSLTALMRISPVLQGNVNIDFTDYSAQDAPRTDRQTTTITTGVSYNASPTTTIDANIGVAQVDETLRAVPSSTTEEDFVANLSWTEILPNGTASAMIDQSFGTNGERTTATVGRSFILPNGSFDFNVGLTRGPFGETTAVGDVNYVHMMPSSQVIASLGRRVGTSNQSTETRETLANLSYDYFINSISSASFGITFAQQEDEGNGPSNRRTRANLNASYTRALTQDWNMTVGYQRQFDDDTGPGSATGNSVFLTIGRQYVLKP